MNNILNKKVFAKQKNIILTQISESYGNLYFKYICTCMYNVYRQTIGAWLG